MPRAARNGSPADVPEQPTLVTVDVSFISATKVMPAIVTVAPDADIVLLVKPQFEAGRGQVPRGGVITDAAVRHDALDSTLAALSSMGLRALDVGFSVDEICGPRERGEPPRAS